MAQPTRVLSSKKGYSLVEVMFAIAILAIVAVALMKSSLLVMQQNLQTELRDEAVRIGEMRMNEIRSGPGGFDNANLDGSNLDLVPTDGDLLLSAVTRTVRSGSTTFNVIKNVVLLDTSTKQVTVTVTWPFRNQTYRHVITSVVRK